MTWGCIARLLISLVLASVLASDPLAHSAVSGLAGGGETKAARFVEVNWPFRIDEWGTGRAFHCRAADCGAEVSLYLRAKVGFCGCNDDVADDDELERVADLVLIGSHYTALAQGQRTSMGPLRGLARSFLIKMPLTRPVPVMAIAINNGCDAVVATVVSNAGITPTVENAARTFLNGDMPVKWALDNTGSQDP
jgi:hypothetical protein